MVILSAACAESIVFVHAARAQSNRFGVPLRYRGEQPSDSEPVFADNIQGITTDGRYWYITQTGDLWKFPIDMDWDAVGPLVPGVSHRELEDYVDGAPFVDENYDHMGDLTYDGHCSRKLLVIPLHGDAPYQSAQLVVDAGNLAAVSWRPFHFCGGSGSDPPTLAAWSAIDDEGVVYFPGCGFSEIVGYKIDCEFLADNGLAFFDFVDRHDLRNENGTLFARHHKQGGAFSPDGTLFCMSTGYETEDSDAVSDGLHMFDTSTWRRIAHSTNGSGLFSFEWDPEEWPEGEEPEGIVWIDFDDGGPPGMDGQMHVLLLNNDQHDIFGIPDSDNIYFKHYTHRIWVDAGYPFDGTGSRPSPFSTVGAANQLAWNGCELRIQAGRYDEAVTITKRMQMTGRGGVVWIGQ